MANRKQYVKPMVCNLSGYGVMGQIPLGMCVDGSSPASSSCSDGAFPTSDPIACNPTGTFPQVGDCNAGDSVIYGCSSGSLV